jgi:hypothetical protein
MGDLHCGHRSGLTPPAWQLNPADDAEPKRLKFAILQRECYTWWIKHVSRLRPINHLIVNGDLIDGTGFRSGGTELITTDRNAQIDMAIKLLRWVGADTINIIRGTPYHTGEREDLEDRVASELQCPIGDHEWLSVNGVVFDCKHAVGSSTIPHGRATPLLKEALWNGIWAEHEEQPRSDVLVRSHVHYHLHAGGMRNGKPWLAMTLPALQGMGTKFGAKKCSGHVDFGFVHFDIDTKGNYSWQAHIAKLQSQKAQISKL